MRELWDVEMLSRVIASQYRTPLIKAVNTLRALFSNVIEKGADLLFLYNRMETALGDIERISDQVKGVYELNLFERRIKLLRRYAGWVRIEANRRTEPEPESS